MHNLDEHFMREAIRLAEKGAGKTSPNPLVGAVVVKNGKVVGRGFHKKAGLPHAEIMALKEAQNKTKGAALYVNMEPCSHFGKTPPCTDTIISCGIKRVVVAMRDPNPVNNGRGITKLKKSGIKIKEGVLKKEARELNRAFTKFITERIPYVTVKVAQSLDGKIAAKTGDSKWISSKDSRRLVRMWRKRVDAGLVGINTVLKDDPRLTIFSKKVIIDSRLRIPIKSRLFDNPSSVIIAATKKAPKKKVEVLKKKNIDVIVTRGNSGCVDLKSLMKNLAKQDIVHILVEGGGETISGFLKEGLVDEMFFFVSPKIIGGRDAVTSVEGKGIKFINEAIPFNNIEVRRIGGDLLLKCLPA